MPANNYPSRAKKRGIYVDSVPVYRTFQAAIKHGAIRSRDASARLSKLMLQDVRRHASKIVAKGIEIPSEVYEN